MRKNDTAIKVIDFGLSYKWKNNMNKELKEMKVNKLIGTVKYVLF